MLILLSPEKRLARVDVNEVLTHLDEVGYYLQMPPTQAQLLQRDGSDN